MKKSIIAIASILLTSLAGFSQSKTISQSKAKSDVQVGLEIGNRAPEIKLADTSGKFIALSSLKGKMVLIDFWASWCGPCRRENPNVVAAYSKFKDKKYKGGKGFTIYSVSLDQQKSPWVAAIRKDGLTWPAHVSDLKYWYSEAAQLYGVSGIPTNWLIDGNGIIVGKNLRGEALEQELLKNVK